MVVCIVQYILNMTQYAVIRINKRSLATIFLNVGDNAKSKETFSYIAFSS